MKTRFHNGPIPVDTRVRYTTRWLDSVGAGPTDPLRHLKGTVVRGKSATFVRVRWDDDRRPMYVHPGNLAGEHEVSAHALDHAKGFSGFDVNGRKVSPWAQPMTK